MNKNEELLKGLFSSNAKFYEIIDKLSSKPYKLLYNGLLPKPIRKILSYRANLAQQNHVAHCWQKLINLYRDNQLHNIEVFGKKNINDKKIIWKYWGQGWNSSELPDIVKICRASVEEYKGDYEIIYLDDNNFKEYIEFPEFVDLKRKNPNFKHAFFSDVLRLALLKCYGGVWVDATFLFTGVISSKLADSNLFVYHRSFKQKNKKEWVKLNRDYFSWDYSHRINVLNSIIYSKKDNYNINLLLQLMLWFWRTQENIPHYFFFQILFDELHKENLIKDIDFDDDTLPHRLFLEFNNPFDESKFREITSHCNQHKLTYVKNCLPGSFYDYFKKKYNL